MAKEISKEEQARTDKMIDDLIKRAKVASEKYMELDQETIDNIVKKII